MLDKARNHLIASAFRKANITSLESDPTPAEIEDAAHTLNVMLQSWNNDGFRLFKIHTGYMPFIPNKNEYSLSNGAYKQIGASDIVRVDRIGATKIQLNDFSNISVGQKFVTVDNANTRENSIKHIDFKAGIVTLASPLDLSIYKTGTVAFYGTFNTAVTQLKTAVGAFNTLSYNDYTVMPAVGDFVCFCYSGNWTKRTISAIDASSKTITIAGTPLSEGSITSTFIAFGSNVMFTTPKKDYLVAPRSVVLKNIDFEPKYIAIPTDVDIDSVFEVESCDLTTNTVIMVESIREDVLYKLGVDKIEANRQYPTKEEVSWTDFANQIPIEELDWGSVADSSDLQTDDWGSVVDAVSTLQDWGTLTGAAVIVGYSESTYARYALVENTTTTDRYLLCDTGIGWQLVDLTGYGLTTYKLFTFADKSYLYDAENGLYLLNGELLIEVYVNIGIEAIIQYKQKFYLVSPKGAGTITRSVVSTVDFNNFDTVYTVELDDLSNPAEFRERMFIGTTETFVGDMLHFMDAGVYSQNRCVIGDRLINLNTYRPCSYTLDGVHFLPMPMMLSNQTAWASKDTCAFIAVYGIVKNGIVSTEIFTANDFNPVWTPQVVVPGRVFDIFFNNYKAYFVSDVAVYSLSYSDSIAPKSPVLAQIYGESIGRPQEIMNVMKLSLVSLMQLPMNPLSLKDFLLLPIETNGEPVNYCFMREAEDGKMMIWGTPNKFGEYLRFSYVEPLTLLEDARSTPDFPDEYYEAVEDGLAAQLAMEYGLPLDRQQALVARAQESKENAILHDNEDTEYDIAPNQRWL